MGSSGLCSDVLLLTLAGDAFINLASLSQAAPACSRSAVGTGEDERQEFAGEPRGRQSNYKVIDVWLYPVFYSDSQTTLDCSIKLHPWQKWRKSCQLKQFHEVTTQPIHL